MPTENDDHDTCSSSSEEEEGFSVEWTNDEILNLLRLHYPHLFHNVPSSEVLIECTKPKKGMENQSIIINFCNLYKFILRIYSDQDKSAEYVAFELDSLYKLRQCCHLPVPHIVETGKFMTSRQDIRDCLVDFKGYKTVMFEFCSGYHINRKKRITMDHVEVVATFTGNLHKNTMQYEQFDPLTSNGVNEPPFLLIDERFQLRVGRYQPERLLFDFVWESLNELFDTYKIDQCEQSALDDQSKRMLLGLHKLSNERLKRYTEKEQDEIERKLPKSLNHGDAHTSNVLFKEDIEQKKPVISAVVDWDDCFVGPCIVDLANGVFFWCTKRQKELIDCNFGSPVLKCYLQTYQRSRGFPLTDLEKSYFIEYLFLTLFSQICFLLSETDVIGPCSEEEQEDEEYQSGRYTLAFFLSLGELMTDQLFYDSY